jgi:hypothetical protein
MMHPPYESTQQYISKNNYNHNQTLTASLPLNGPISHLIRQADGKSGSRAQLGCHLYPSPVFFDEFAGDHQAQTGASMAFGAEEGSKQLLQYLLIHAGTVIRNFKFDDIILFQLRFQFDLPLFADIFVK